jgi:hypothetical protein
VPVRIEEIIERIRREIAEEPAGQATDRATRADVESLPAISGRAELEYLNRHWALFDPLSEMHSHRRLLGPMVVRFRWAFRRLVIGVLDRYFEKERAFLLELVRFNNALAERTDRILREVTDRTKAVAERNDLFLGALDLRLEALEAREQLRRAAEGTPAVEGVPLPPAEEEAVAEMVTAFGAGVGERLRPFVDRVSDSGRVLLLGCGDGEAFTPFRERSAEVVGVEASAALVAVCRSRGYTVEQASLGPYLESVPEGSLSGLAVTGIADRHPRAGWARLVAASWRVLRPGGVAAFEGVGDRDGEARMRWLLSRQRFAIVEVCEFAAHAREGREQVVVARRGEAA